MADELTKALNEKNLVIGADKAIKNLKKGKSKKVLISNNCPEKIKQEIIKYKDKAEIIQLEINSEELNVRCKKPFNIAVLSY
ncbi:ribosomal L7Ae/L30e/S12e/Gadd45 family protein [Candidatus Woesearchaeota archaeon]|nr:ribosomal L7Ae/L30e/S12e/Gadd45 family protein [Candidatus Woesearchaeota archaeon]